MFGAKKYIQGKPYIFSLLRKVLSVFLLFGALQSPLFSQETDVSSILSADDKEEIKKADELIKEADGLMEEANQYYLETFEVQADYSLSEKEMEKKVDQLESKAIKKQISASNLYEKANKIKFNTYKKYSDSFWKEQEGDESLYTNAKLIEEQAKDFMLQAKSKRSDALKQSDVTQKSTLLNEAYSLENQAIDKEKTALSQYYGLDVAYTDQVFQPEEQEETVTAGENYTPDETHTTPTYESSAQQSVSSGTQGNVSINNSVVSKYNTYVEDESIPDPVVFNSQGLGNMETFDMNKATSMWDEYQGTETYGSQIAAKSDTAAEELTEEMAENTSYSTEDNYPTESNATTSTSAAGEEPASYVVQSEEEAKDLVEHHIPADEDVIYRVQIAANQSRLSQKALSNIYYGQKQVEMINEDGWYKYSVGDFETFAEADAFRKQSGTSNAIIVAYRRGTLFVPEETEKPHVSSVVSYERGTSTGIIFNVQVAASRAPLTRGQVASIYKGDCTVELVEEDGWYKYQISGFRLYTDANKVKQSTGVKGVFISAYKDGRKIPIKQAIEENKPLVDAVKTRGRRGQVVEIDFHVQIIASKARLSASTIAEIYQGTNSVIMVIEEGWYKYQINAGSNYDNAKMIRSQCGVPNAFIVAYKHGKKQKLYNSIRESGYNP